METCGRNERRRSVVVGTRGVHETRRSTARTGAWNDQIVPWTGKARTEWCKRGPMYSIEEGVLIGGSNARHRYLFKYIIIGDTGG